jgi:hypothetical protein
MQPPNDPQSATKASPRRKLWLLIFPFFAVCTILMVTAALYPLLVVGGPHRREHMDETSSVATLRTIHSLQNKYAATHPKKGFACELASLKLEDFQKTNSQSGYQFAVSDCHANSSGLVVHYQATAVPVEPGTSSLRTFCMDDSGVLWFSTAGSGADCLTARRLLQ